MPSKSKQQQKFMGMVHALQKGDMKPSDASASVKKVAKSMKKSDTKDFASTKHKELPRKVKQELLTKLKEYASKLGTNTMGGDDYTSKKKGGLRDFDGYDNVDYNKDMPMDEATKGDVMRAVKGKPNPYSLVVIKKGKVIYQKDIKNPQDAPAVYSVIRKHMDKGERIHIEDRTGQIVFKEGINESMMSTIDQIRKDSNSVKDFIKKVFSDKDFRDMKGDKDFIKYLGSIYEGVTEGGIPQNWMQGRTSDYHTKLRGKKREYDDTNFEKDNSGQTDLEEAGFDKLEHLKLLNKAMRAMPGSPKQKEIIRQLNKVRKAGGMRPLKEATKPDFNSKGYKEADKLVSKLRSSIFRKLNDDEIEQFRAKIAREFDLKESIVKEAGYSLSDLIGQVKTFDKPKTQKLLTIMVINKLKEKRNNSKSKSNKVKIQKLIDKIEGDYKKGKFIKEYGQRLDLSYLEDEEARLDGTPKPKDAIDRDLGEEYKRDYKAEYKKFQSSTKSKKYRAELNKYNRDKGTYGNGDGKDASHKGGKIVGFESASKNRGRREKSRLKKK